MSHKRNYDGIQYEDERRAVEVKYTITHDRLETAYYKHWKLGKSDKGFKDLTGYDVILKDAKLDAVATKTQFDKLHGLTDMERSIAVYDAYMERDEKDQVDKEVDDLTARKDEANPKVAMYKTTGIELDYDAIKDSVLGSVNGETPPVSGDA